MSEELGGQKNETIETFKNDEGFYEKYNKSENRELSVNETIDLVGVNSNNGEGNGVEKKAEEDFSNVVSESKKLEDENGGLEDGAIKFLDKLEEGDKKEKELSRNMRAKRIESRLEKIKEIVEGYFSKKILGDYLNLKRNRKRIEQYKKEFIELVREKEINLAESRTVEKEIFRFLNEKKAKRVLKLITESGKKDLKKSKENNEQRSKEKFDKIFGLKKEEKPHNMDYYKQGIIFENKEGIKWKISLVRGLGDIIKVVDLKKLVTLGKFRLNDKVVRALKEKGFKRVEKWKHPVDQVLETETIEDLEGEITTVEEFVNKFYQGNKDKVYNTIKSWFKIGDINSENGKVKINITKRDEEGFISGDNKGFEIGVNDFNKIYKALKNKEDNDAMEKEIKEIAERFEENMKRMGKKLNDEKITKEEYEEIVSGMKGRVNGKIKALKSKTNKMNLEKINSPDPEEKGMKINVNIDGKNNREEENTEKEEIWDGYDVLQQARIDKDKNLTSATMTMRKTGEDLADKNKKEFDKALAELTEIEKDFKREKAESGNNKEIKKSQKGKQEDEKEINNIEQGKNMNGNSEREEISSKDINEDESEDAELMASAFGVKGKEERKDYINRYKGKKAENSELGRSQGEVANESDYGFNKMEADIREQRDKIQNRQTAKEIADDVMKDMGGKRENKESVETIEDKLKALDDAQAELVKAQIELCDKKKDLRKLKGIKNKFGFGKGSEEKESVQEEYDELKKKVDGARIRYGEKFDAFHKESNEKDFSEDYFAREDAMLNAKLENMGEKGLVLKKLSSIYGKWNKLNKPTKIAISTALATGAVATFVPALGVLGVLGYAGKKALRSSISGAAATATSGFLQNKFLKKKEEKDISKLKEDLESGSKDYFQMMEKIKNKRKWRGRISTGTIIAVGMAMGVGVSSLGEVAGEMGLPNGGKDGLLKSLAGKSLSDEDVTRIIKNQQNNILNLVRESEDTEHYKAYLMSRGLNEDQVETALQNRQKIIEASSREKGLVDNLAKENDFVDIKHDPRGTDANLADKDLSDLASIKIKEEDIEPRLDEDFKDYKLEKGIKIGKNGTVWGNLEEFYGNTPDDETRIGNLIHGFKKDLVEDIMNENKISKDILTKGKLNLIKEILEDRFKTLQPDQVIKVTSEQGLEIEGFRNSNLENQIKNILLSVKPSDIELENDVDISGETPLDGNEPLVSPTEEQIKRAERINSSENAQVNAKAMAEGMEEHSERAEAEHEVKINKTSEQIFQENLDNLANNKELGLEKLNSEEWKDYLNNKTLGELQDDLDNYQNSAEYNGNPDGFSIVANANIDLDTAEKLRELLENSNNLNKEILLKDIIFSNS